MIVFLDFEASSLSPGSWPVEVGWAADGEVAESHLIRPSNAWVDWDTAAQAVHGLPLAYLREQAEPAELVGRRVLDVLASPGASVFSDAAGWEQLWLDCLLREAGLPLSIKVRPASRIYQVELRRLLELAPPPQKRWYDHVVRALDTEAKEILADVHAAELQRQRIRHRAGPDSEAAQWILLEIRGRVDARLGQGRGLDQREAPRQNP